MRSADVAIEERLLPKGRTDDARGGAGRLGYGAMALAGPPRGKAVPEDQAFRLLELALELGITFIDTSIDYGRSEVLIGQCLSRRRDEFFLATKCGCSAGFHPTRNPSPHPHEYTPENVRRGLEQSLTRLRTSTVDLLQLHHSPSPETLVESGVLEELAVLRGEGKFRLLGISTTGESVLPFLKLGIFDVVQMPLTSDPEADQATWRSVRSLGLRTIVRGAFCRHNDRPGPRLDLGDILEHPDVDVVLVGTSSPDHMRENASLACRSTP